MEIQNRAGESRILLVEDDTEIREGTEISGTVDAIESAVVGGNTCYYFTLKGSRQVYTAEISVSELLPFLKADEKVKFPYTDDGNVRDVIEFLD